MLKVAPEMSPELVMIKGVEMTEASGWGVALLDPRDTERLGLRTKSTVAEAERPAGSVAVIVRVCEPMDDSSTGSVNEPSGPRSSPCGTPPSSDQVAEPMRWLSVTVPVAVKEPSCRAAPGAGEPTVTTGSAMSSKRAR